MLNHYILFFSCRNSDINSRFCNTPYHHCACAYYAIAANAGLEGSVIVNKVRESEAGIGFDAYKEEYCDMVACGIIDPAKVTRSALENAASVASMVLTTESLVADKPDPAADAAQAAAMAAAAQGGMY